MIQWHEHTAEQVAVPYEADWDRDAASTSVATLAAAVIGAEAGLLCLPAGVVRLVGGEARMTKARRYIPVDPGPEAGSTAWHRLVDGLRTMTRQPATISDLREHALFADLTSDDLGGLVSYAGVPLHDRQGRLVGLIGVLDTVARDWSVTDLAMLDDMARFVRPEDRGPDLPLGADVQAPALTKVVGEIVSSLDDANGGLEGLLSHAESFDDAGLQRRAGMVQRHLDALRTHATRMRAEVASSSHGAVMPSRFDLGSLVNSTVRDVCVRSGLRPLPCDVENDSLWVHADQAAIRRTVTALLETALNVAAPEAISVIVSSHAFASDLLEGSLTAEFRLDVRDVAVDAGDLCRALAPRAGSTTGSGGSLPWSQVELTRGEFRLTAPGIEARIGSWGTRLVVRWPLDLG